MMYETARNAYFQIDLPDYGPTVNNRIDPADIISLTIIEELTKSIQGSISMNDPGMTYADILRFNAELNIQWGYKAQGADIAGLFATGTKTDQFSANFQRRGLSTLVMNPKGEARPDGTVGYTCGFLSKGWFGSPQYKTFDKGTKGDVVRATLVNMGAKETFVRFDASEVSYNSESVERQCESDFSFLARLSSEWRCMFKMGYAQDGTTYGIFCQYKNVPVVQQMLKQALGVDWEPLKISWKTGDSRDLIAISYDWANQEGENGQGDNVQMTIINGKPTFQRFTMEGESIIVWTLNSAAVNDYVQKGHDISPILNATNFQDPQIKQFWTSAKQTTAPNGLGYTINIHMFGNPMVTAGMLVQLGEGFPPMLYRAKTGTDPVQFVVLKATHTLGMGGYFTDLQVIDIFSLSAVGVR